MQYDGQQYARIEFSSLQSDSKFANFRRFDNERNNGLEEGVKILGAIATKIKTGFI
jgi:hypothetical protein